MYTNSSFTKYSNGTYDACYTFTHMNSKEYDDLVCRVSKMKNDIEHGNKDVVDEDIASEGVANNETTDMVDHPSHYNQSPMECIDEMILIFGKKAVANFCLCNVWKYRNRAPYKGNPIEDAKKADWYMTKYKELMENTDKSALYTTTPDSKTQSLRINN